MIKLDIVVAYDIADTNTLAGATRLRKVADVCSAYGQRVQWSVFECRLSPTRHARFLSELIDIINPAVDSILIYQFHGSIQEHRTSIGVDRAHKLGISWIL